jgi:thiamine biosynthesis lipoprotein
MISTSSSLRVLVPTRIRADLRESRGEVLVLRGACMGTSWEVRVAGITRERAVSLYAEIATILETIEAQMSHFREASDLSRFARLPAGHSLQLPVEFAHVLRTALDVAEKSEGAFDPTLARAISAWGFGPGINFSEAAFLPPAPPEASGAAWRSLSIDEANCVRQPGGVALNLAAIAKGFAVDAVAGYLARFGFDNHLVEVGGELRGSGMKPDGQAWWVALELPAEDCPLPTTRVALHGLAVATSGSYRRHFHADGRDLQHTLDPRTGAPVRHSLASVTVVHEECMLADAWATAIMVLGPQEGLALAHRQGLAALLQWSDLHAGQLQWREASSEAWKEMEQ